MNKIAIAAAFILAAPVAAHADKSPTAYGDAIQAGTTDHYRGWIINKLTTWKVGATCWEKIQKSDGRVVSLGSHLTRALANYAKTVTGDDWASIEGSGTSEKAANKGKVEPLIDAFKSKFSLSVSIDGDDCDDGHDPLWMQYVMHAAEDIEQFPPASGKAFISINVSSKPKTKFSIAVDKTGSKFTITGPKDIASDKWQNQMEAAFKKVAKKT
jgi:hypothetical protein